MIRSRVKRILRTISYKKLPSSVDLTSDEFLVWLGFAVPGMTGKGNIDSIAYAISHLPTHDPIVEIGSFCGLSTVYISHFRSTYGKANQLYTCDKWKFEGQKLGELIGLSKTITHDEYRQFVKETYVRNVAMFCKHDLPFTVELLSDEFFKLWKEKKSVTDVFNRETTLGGPIAFAFIDGNHTYEFAKRDFENVDTLLVNGGFILFDDSSDYSGWDVNHVVKEVAKIGRYELIAKNPNYLFRKT